MAHVKGRWTLLGAKGETRHRPLKVEMYSCLVKKRRVEYFVNFYQCNKAFVRLMSNCMNEFASQPSQMTTNACVLAVFGRAGSQSPSSHLNSELYFGNQMKRTGWECHSIEVSLGPCVAFGWIASRNVTVGYASPHPRYKRETTWMYMRLWRV